MRNRLISAMVDHALNSGIRMLTGVVAASFRRQVLAMGWDARALGEVHTIGSQRLGAFGIAVTADTPSQLFSSGIYSKGAIEGQALEQAA